VAADVSCPSLTEPLHSLPPQPEGVPWPTADWPTGPVPSAVDLGPVLDAAFDEEGPLATTYAVVVVHQGRLVAERYGGALPHFDRPPLPVERDTPLLSWSMAKSVLHTAVGLLVGEGRLDPDAPAAVPEWTAPGDPRGAITLDLLLQMRDGLDFAEDYEDERASDVIEMLFGGGSDDVARFAADRPLAAPPGERFNYSSGTSNIVSGIVARLLGPGDPYRRFLEERLFGPLGMRSATPTFDDAGTWVASSTLHATARDFARFGLFILRDGWWEGTRLLPEGWVDGGRRPRSVDDEGGIFGRHWWVEGDDLGTFRASGFHGQYVLLCPDLDLVVVRLGDTGPEHKEELVAWRASAVAAFARAPAAG